MNIRRIIKNCIDDRKLVYSSSSTSFIKKFSIDLIIKILILLINSVGIRNTNDKKVSLFVDEINNKNMSRNLRNTYEKSVEHGNKSLLIDYYKFKFNNCHLKIGILLPGVLIIFTILISAVTLFVDIVTNKSFNMVMKLLVLIQILYLFLINTMNCSECYLMTDHHFFSSIIANTNVLDTVVLQHGIVGKDFFYPIRADAFYAWGRHSKEILNNSDKIRITGTFKFDSLISKSNDTFLHSNKNTVNIMYCVTSLDNQKTSNEIIALCNFVKKHDGYNLIVKDHPGSLFDKIINEKYDLAFAVYKEESIDEIDFDLAIVGCSTIILDLAVLKKPFIYFDKTFNYFYEYKDLFYSASCIEELYNCILNYKTFDYNDVYTKIYANELNNLECSIFE